MVGSRLLDTSAIAALLRGDEALIQKLELLDDVRASVIAIGEVLYGAWYSSRSATNLQHVASLASSITTVRCDEDTAHVYGRVKHDLRRKGRLIPDNDLWIAATAIQHGLSLVNRDTHFDSIDELQRESW